MTSNSSTSHLHLATTSKLYTPYERAALNNIFIRNWRMRIAHTLSRPPIFISNCNKYALILEEKVEAKHPRGVRAADPNGDSIFVLKTTLHLNQAVWLDNKIEQKPFDLIHSNACTRANCPNNCGILVKIFLPLFVANWANKQNSRFLLIF